MGLSFRLDNFAEGGLLQPGVYRFTDARFGPYQYPNSDTVTFALTTHLLAEDGQVNEQAWSAGDLKGFAASPDGQEIIAMRPGGRINKATNFYQLYKSYVEAGFPEGEEHPAERADDTFENLVAYLDWEDVPGRAYICRHCPDRFDAPEKLQAHQQEKHGDANTVRRAQVLVVQQIVSLPWEWKGPVAGRVPVPGAPPSAAGAPGAPGAVGGTAGAAPARRRGTAPAAGTETATAAAPAPSLDADAGLKALIVEELGKAESIAVPALRAAIFRDHGADPRRAQWMALLNQEAWKAGLLDTDGIAYADNAFKVA